MAIITRESLYEYQIKKVINKFVKENEYLQNLNAEELQEEIWTNFSKEFGRAMLENISEFSGDELFEIEK